MIFERCQRNGPPTNTDACHGESGYGIYAYLPSLSMRQYYSANGEDVYELEHVRGEVVNLCEKNMPMLLEFAITYSDVMSEQMNHYLKPKIAAETIQRFPRIIEDFIHKNFPDCVAYILPHRGHGIPSGKQVIIRDISAFNIQLLERGSKSSPPHPHSKPRP